MSYFELSCYVECPHCGEENSEHFEFNMESGDGSGVNSSNRQIECDECFKMFYATAYCAFDVSAEVSKKKSKVKK